MKFGSVTDGYGNAISGGGGALTTYYIPDPSSWTDTGVTSPVTNAGIIRVGSTLYAFGGSILGAATNKIHTAIYGSGPPTFVDSGATLPTAMIAPRISIINDGSSTKLWIFGAEYPNLNIHSAPIATPLVWTNTGVTLGRCDNCGFTICNGVIALIRGNHDGTGGGGLSTIQYTSTANPSSGWATSPTMLSALTWECGSYAYNNSIIEYGGVTFTGIGKHVSRTFSTLSSIAAGYYNQANTILQVDTPNSPISCDNGNEIFCLGYGTTNVITTLLNQEFVANWTTLYNVLPASAAYIGGNAPWIDVDGYAYFIHPTSKHIIKSGRKAVYVPAQTPPNSNPYLPLYGVYADGSSAIVSSHVRTGIAPWLHNLTTAF